MDNTISFQDQDTKTQKEDDEEEEDQEEALSFCDFPLNPNEPQKNNSYSKTQDHRRSSSQPSDVFEFFNDLKSKNISHAEDIISCGKLVPYKQQQQQQPPDLVHDQILKSISGDYDSTNSSRRSCESLPELNPTRSNSSSRLTRGSRSLDSRKLRRNSSMVVVKSQNSNIERSSSKGSVKSEGINKVLKPRWYALMFGNLVKFPPEMDLRDMKNRQVRRNPGSMFPAEGSFPANRRSSWGHDLLRVLSCKNHTSVTVTAS